MSAKNPESMHIGIEEIVEQAARNFVEEARAMNKRLKAIEEFIETGKLPDGYLSKDMSKWMDEWDQYCEDKYKGERKKEMEDELAVLREKLESKINKEV